MSDKKYELTDDTIVVDGFTLYRIKALRDFFYIKKGDLGGYVATEENLGHTGLAWIDDNARVYGNARIYGNALVYNNACVCGYAHVFNNAHVSNNAYICDYACVYDNACVYGNARVSNAMIYGEACICDDAIIECTEDYMMFGPFGSRNATTTIYRTATGAQVICGCFCGTLDEFCKKVKETYGDNRYAREYLAIADIGKIRFGKGEEN